MRRLSILAALCLLSACATETGGGGSETDRKYVVFFTSGSAAIDASGTVRGRSGRRRGREAQPRDDARYGRRLCGRARQRRRPTRRCRRWRADVVAAALEADGVAGRAGAREPKRPPANETPAVAARRVEIGFAPAGSDPRPRRRARC